MKKIKVEEKILQANENLGDKIHKILKKEKIFSLNFMASPGAGKTSVILNTIKRLTSVKIGVIEGDIVDIDVKEIRNTKTPVVLANTGGNCHLDAVMIEKALTKLDLNKIDLLIVENVGNLVCPANFYLGTDKSIVIASVPEGDDKPYKYPGMFKGADVVLINKTDYLAYQPFDIAYFSRGVTAVNPKVKIFPISCRTGEGLEEWIKYLKNNLK